MIEFIDVSDVVSGKVYPEPRPVVYAIIAEDRNTILYVGHTEDIGRRIKGHRKGGGRYLAHPGMRVCFFPGTREDEAELIAALSPPLNTQHVDRQRLLARRWDR